MKKDCNVMIVVTVSIIFVFIVSTTIPAIIALNIRSPDEMIEDEEQNYNCYNASKKYCYKPLICKSSLDYVSFKAGEIKDMRGSIQSLGISLDSPWPMYCHDTHHTGRSPYSTIDTWAEIWRFKQDKNDFVRGSPAVGNDGTVYFGGMYFYALYPNGTVKWKYEDVDCYVWSAPAIDENGVIYVGTVYGNPSTLNAIYTINGTLKWKYGVCNMFSSPAIGDDGTIYFSDGETWNIVALYPNGTLKWIYHTDMVVYSSPAIGQDGTIYCGSHDTYLYALYPNNGTLKWKYKTGDWIRTSPCIADDGTIYVVSLDGYLYAINPVGSLKWKTDVGAGTSPTIGQDDTIYCGYSNLYAINPTNGSVKWIFNPGPGRTIRGATPCNSIDGTIYFGTHIGDYGGGEIIAVNPDGTERWRKMIANQYVDSAPAIGEDGTVYIGSACDDDGSNIGYLHAFGIGPLEADADGPYYGLINQPVQFKGKATGGYSPYAYHWIFGDGGSSEVQNPTHIYTSAGNYTVTLVVTDNTSNTSSDTTWAWIQTTNTPPNKPTITGTTKGKPGTSYDYIFKTTDIDGTDIWYYIEWGDGTNSGWIGPCGSGEEITQSHTWNSKGTFTIRCKAKDPYNAESDWGTLQITMPRSRVVTNTLFLRFLEHFPLLEKLLSKLILIP